MLVPCSLVAHTGNTGTVGSRCRDCACESSPHTPRAPHDGRPYLSPTTAQSSRLQKKQKSSTPSHTRAVVYQQILLPVAGAVTKREERGGPEPGREHLHFKSRRILIYPHPTSPWRLPHVEPLDRLPCFLLPHVCTQLKRLRLGAMSDAAVKVDPDFYNARLLETETNGGARRAAANFGGGGGSGGGGGGGRNGGRSPDLPDYLVRQHSLLGFYLSLNPGDEGRLCLCTVYAHKREGIPPWSVCPHTW